MTINDHGVIYSDLAIPPGETLADEIAARGMSQTELATRLGRPVQVVNEIIHGKKAITDDTALGLETVLGIPAAFWVNLEQNYRMTRARLRERERLQAEEEWLEELPVREMQKRGWIAAGLEPPGEGACLATVLRRGECFRLPQDDRSTRLSHLGTMQGCRPVPWRRGCARAKLEAQKIETSPFDSALLLAAARGARSFTEQPPQEFAPRLTQLFADAGVAFVVVRELPKTGANGVARWLTDQKALIQLNLSYKWQDIFWFTLFHEVCHVLNHRNQKIIIDGIEKNGPLENEANQWSADFLVPADRWTHFRHRTPFTKR